MSQLYSNGFVWILNLSQSLNVSFHLHALNATSLPHTKNNNFNNSLHLLHSLHNKRQCKQSKVHCVRRLQRCYLGSDKHKADWVLQSKWLAISCPLPKLLGSGTLSSSIICPLHTKLPGNNTGMLPSPPRGQDLCLYNKLYSLGTFESHGDNADRLSVLCHTHNCYVGIM